MTLQSISQLVLHNGFLLGFEVFPEQTIDSIDHQLAGSLIKIRVSARKPKDYGSKQTKRYTRACSCRVFCSRFSTSFGASICVPGGTNFRNFLFSLYRFWITIWNCTATSRNKKKMRNEDLKSFCCVFRYTDELVILLNTANWNCTAASRKHNENCEKQLLVSCGLVWQKHIN